MIGETIRHYHILSELGRGGMGVVYKAEDTHLHRPVALKFLPTDMMRDSAGRRRFEQEARAASALDHPNIAVVHDIDETDDGRSFICMAYYDGVTLKEKIAAGPMSVTDLLQIAIQIADGLERAHDAGIVHRDIKPANILITPRQEVKILDFGLAKLNEESSITTLTSRVGTASYMSPEQIREGIADPRSDLFALGVVLYEMSTGQRPFAGAHEAAVFYSTVNVDPLPPRRIRPDLPADLDRIIMTLLEKDPAHRYQSAHELQMDLQKLRDTGSGFTLHKPGKLAALVARHRYVIASVAFLAVAAGAFLLTRTGSSRIPLQPSEYIVLSDFENLTENRALDHSLTEAMKVSLRQSARVNILPPERIAEALARMKAPPGHGLPESLAVPVARRERARIVIAGSVGLVGSTYLLSCRIIDAVSGESVRLLHRNAASIESVLPEMDELCEAIRRALGESIQEISQYTMPLEKVTTPSLEALELYSRGNSFEGDGKYQEAALLKSQAYGKDTSFTLAVSDLSYIYRKLGNDSLALFFHKKVLPLLGRVTDRERYYILSIYYGPTFEFDYQKAYESLRQLVLRYPNSPEGYATLGHLAMYAGDFSASLEASRRSLAIDSVYAPTIFNNMGYALTLSGDPRAGLEYYRKSKQIRPQYFATELYIAQAYWIMEQYDSVEHCLQTLLPRADTKMKFLTYSELVSLYYFCGKLREAEKVCTEAIAFSESATAPGDEAFFHLLLGDLLIDLRNEGDALQQYRRARELSRSPYPELPLVAARYARRGRIREAEQIRVGLAGLQSADPYFVKRRADFLHYMRGEILLAQKRPAEALREFRAVAKIHSGDPFYLQAQLGSGLAQLQMSDANAIGTYQKILEMRSEVVMGWVLSVRKSGPWIRSLWPEVERDLGALYLQQGDYNRAGEHISRCLKTWEKADDGFPPAETVRHLALRVQQQK